MNKEKTRGWLGHPSIIKNLEQQFGKRAMKERPSLTSEHHDLQEEDWRILRKK